MEGLGFDVVFLGTREGYCYASMTPYEKWWRDRLRYAISFKSVLSIIRIKIRQLIGENKWKI